MKTVADKVKEMDVDVIVGPAMGGIVYAYELEMCIRDSLCTTQEKQF